MSIPSFDDAIMSIVRFVESGRAFGSLKLTHSSLRDCIHIHKSTERSVILSSTLDTYRPRSSASASRNGLPRFKDLLFTFHEYLLTFSDFFA
jgi:hypothetical protein